MSGGHYPPSYHVQPPQEFIAPRHRLPVIPPQGPPSTFNSSGSISHAHTSPTPWINKHNFSNFHENASYYSQPTPKNYSPSTRTHFNEESNWSEPPFSNPAPLMNVYRGTPQNDKMESRICTNYPRDDVQQESMDLSSAAHVPTITSPKTTPETALSVNGSPAEEPLKDCVNGTAPKRVPSPKKEAVSVIAPNPLREKASHIVSLESIKSSEIHEPVIKSNKETVEEKVIKEQIPPDHVESILETMFHSDVKSSVTSTTSSVIVTAQSCKTPDLRAESVEKILKSPSPERCDNLESDLELNSSEFETTKDGELADVSSSVADLTIDLGADASPKLTIDESRDKEVEVEDLTTDKTVIAQETAPSEKIDPSSKNIDEQLARMDEFEVEPPKKDEISSKSEKCDKPVESQKDDTEKPKAGDSAKDHEKGKNRSEEITYVEVESELEKMFAGIEDTERNNVDNDPLNAMPTDSSITDTSKLSPRPASEPLPSSGQPPAVKATKKKSSKKSKSASVKKDTKSKHPLSKDTSSTDNVIFKRVPVIHVQGSKENPISVQIINSIKLEEDDISDAKNAAKRKQSKSDRATKRLAASYSVKNYDPESSDESWICIFCKLSAHSPGVAGEPTGELFGPYFIRDPNQPNTDSDSKRHSRKTDHLAELVKKKQKRSLSLESNHAANIVEHKSIEIWAHESCFVWASGIHLVGSKLVGLEDAVIEALQTICAHCGENGASIGCRARHCKTFVHYSCGLYTGWRLDPETFITVCNLHKGTH